MDDLTKNLTDAFGMRRRLMPDSVCFGPDINAHGEMTEYFTVCAIYGQWHIDIASGLTPEEALDLCREEMNNPNWEP